MTSTLQQLQEWPKVVATPECLRQLRDQWRRQPGAPVEAQQPIHDLTLPFGNDGFISRSGHRAVPDLERSGSDRLAQEQVGQSPFIVGRYGLAQQLHRDTRTKRFVSMERVDGLLHEREGRCDDRPVEYTTPGLTRPFLDKGCLSRSAVPWGKARTYRHFVGGNACP